MSKADTPNRWFAGWRAAERPAQDDPADLGTAFGLDMSLNETALRAPTAAPATWRPNWVKRLGSRRKPAV